MLCQNCRRKIPNNVAFCRYCGTRQEQNQQMDCVENAPKDADAKGNKLPFAYVNRMISKIRGTQNKLKAIARIDLTDKQNAVAKKEKALWEKQIIETMTGISVDELNREKTGVRTSNLKRYGIDNMWQLYAIPSRRLMGIEGIGSASVHKCKQIATDIFNKTVENHTTRISSENITKESTDLVRALYALRKGQDIVNRSRELISTYLDDIESAIVQATPAKGGIRWMLASKKKKSKVQDGIERLEGYINGDFIKNAEEIINDSKKAYFFTEDECWEDYKDNVASYNVTLEKCSGRKMTVVGDTYLSNELTEEIKNVAVNESALRNCELRPYQKLGIQYIINQRRVLLGDEMGLGKTVEAIGTMASLYANGATHFLVICPAAVLVNWCREIQRFSTIPTIMVYGAHLEYAIQQWKEFGGVAVTTFESSNSFEFSDTFRYEMLVVDEAHYVKNPNANRTKSVVRKGEHAKRILYMTGTPLENSVNEMHYLIHCLQPLIAQQVKGMMSMASSPMFREKIAPVYLRRKREQVLKELPKLIQTEVTCPLEGKDLADYKEQVFNRSFMGMRQISWHTKDMENSAKSKALLEICNRAIDQGNKVIIFSFFLDTIASIYEKCKQELGNRCFGPLSGSVKTDLRQEIVDDFSSFSGGAILFSQIQAGGTGLNIQKANIVILCEPQIKPSIEDQAIARAYRMGQDKTVLVYRLICENSVDEIIMEVLKNKRKEFDSFAEHSVSGEKSIEISESNCNEIMDQEAIRLFGFIA